MRSFIPVVSAVAVLGCVLFALSAQIQKEQPAIFNFTLINNQFCTGGQPKLEALEKLKTESVKSILNLRTPPEHRAADEEAKAKELGLSTSIPRSLRNPKTGRPTFFCRFPTTRQTVRCSFIVRRPLSGRLLDDTASPSRRLDRGSGPRGSAEDRSAEAPHLVDFARAYIAKHQKK